MRYVQRERGVHQSILTEGIADLFPPPCSPTINGFECRALFAMRLRHVALPGGGCGKVVPARKRQKAAGEYDSHDLQR